MCLRRVHFYCQTTIHIRMQNWYVCWSSSTCKTFKSFLSFRTERTLQYRAMQVSLDSLPTSFLIVLYIFQRFHLQLYMVWKFVPMTRMTTMFPLVIMTVYALIFTGFFRLVDRTLGGLMLFRPAIFTTSRGFTICMIMTIPMTFCTAFHIKNSLWHDMK